MKDKSVSDSRKYRRLLKAVQLALQTFDCWCEADGMFPDPEYDLFLDAMTALEKEANADRPLIQAKE